MGSVVHLHKNKFILLFFLPGLILIFIILNISLGSVQIPLKDLWKLIIGESNNVIYTNIILKSRIPQTITACLAGSALAVSGLILQTIFKNPLAGPSVLGINSGAGLGVAFVTMFFTGTYQISSYGSMMHISSLVAAFLGAVLIMVIILFMAAKVKNNAMLLIIGLMIGYITSSVVSVLKYYSMQENIHAFVMWGLGSFSNTSWQDMYFFIPVILIGLLLSLLAVKSLNMLNLGERYAQNLGLNIKTSRFFIILITSLLASVITAFCGPIAFLGLAVPHISRLLSHSTDHKILIPHTMLTGAMLALLCNLLARMPWTDFTLPINAVTSIFGAPVVIYIILKKRNLL